MMFGGLSAMHLVKSGQLKLIGALSPKRLEQYPDVPTAAESGLPGYELSNTYAVYAPIKTPPAILNLLNREIEVVVRSPELMAKLAADFVDPAPPAAPDELKRIVNAEVERWDGVVKRGNIKAE
jgi:tripartite-type tricarboxylate transporter receptor subunit TctC